MNTRIAFNVFFKTIAGEKGIFLGTFFAATTKNACKQAIKVFGYKAEDLYAVEKT